MYSKGEKVVCINTDLIHDLTRGNVYIVINDDFQTEAGVRVINDVGNDIFYAQYRFISLSIYRRNKIDSILNIL